jgi:hypothetical protein
MSQLQIMQQLKFTTGDLQANRAGTMSEAQRDKFKPAEPNLLVVGVVVGHLLLIGGILGVIAFVTGERALWVVFAIVCVLMALPFVLLQNEGNISPLLKADAKAGKVKMTCGMAIIEQKQGRTVYHTLTINSVTMRLSATQVTAFIHGRHYCAYYLPQSKTLLSAEPHQADA